MRTIRFRGKDIKTGEWHEGYYAVHHVAEKGNHGILLGYREIPCIFNDEEGERSKGGYWHTIDPTTLGQLLTYKDCHGKPIYEGDILRSDNYPFSDGKEKDNYLGVVFCTEDGSFEVMQFVTKQSKRRGISNFINRPFYDINIEKVEVIGNIYDNKGLFRDSDEKIMEWYNS